MEPVPTTSQEPRRDDAPRRRADARRNQDRVFAEAGLQGTVPQVAERADVGKATVYRSYPTKEDLVEAVVRHRMAELERVTGPASRQADAARAFDSFVLALFAHLAQDRLLSEALADVRSAAYTGPLLDRLESLMEGAKAEVYLGIHPRCAEPTSHVFRRHREKPHEKLSGHTR